MSKSQEVFTVCVCVQGLCVCVSEWPVVSGAMSTKSSESQTADMSDCVCQTVTELKSLYKQPGGLTLKSLFYVGKYSI